jgi:hypothetical protein
MGSLRRSAMVILTTFGVVPGIRDSLDSRPARITPLFRLRKLLLPAPFRGFPFDGWRTLGPVAG